MATFTVTSRPASRTRRILANLPRFLVRRRSAVAVMVSIPLAVAVVAAAALLIRLDIAASPSAVASDVTLAAGDDYAAINAAGFATLTVGSSGTSAALSMSGIPGAAQVQLGNVMALTNADATQAYTVTLTRSALLDTDFTGFTVTVLDGASTLVTWNAVSSATSAAFTLPAATSLDITITTSITDGVAPGALDAFSIQVSLAPA